MAIERSGDIQRRGKTTGPRAQVLHAQAGTVADARIFVPSGQLERPQQHPSPSAGRPALTTESQRP